MEHFLFNGVDRRTGAIYAPARSTRSPERLSGRFLPRWENCNDLGELGWGLVFAANDPEASELRLRLAPLFEKRREEAGGRAVLLEYFDGITVADFRRIYRGLYQRIDPQKLPYYLLLVGSPEKIPFEFQYHLAASHGVGRLHFETPEAYTLYVANVLAEEASPSRPRRVAFWAADHPAEHNSLLTTESLTEPLSREVQKVSQGFRIESYLGSAARKETLEKLLGPTAPALLFTSGHGLFFSKSGDPDQRAEQGALICSDWLGPITGPPQPEHFYTVADHLASRGRGPRGLISFHFACNSAGTPQLDNYYFKQDPQRRKELAPAPFVSALAKGLLGSPAGSLAFIGHVERCWTDTFLWRQIGAKPSIYATVIEGILRGIRLGAALEIFSQVAAEISQDLLGPLRETPGAYDLKTEQPGLLAKLSDVQSFVILGDPAVRISARSATQKTEET